MTKTLTAEMDYSDTTRPTTIDEVADILSVTIKRDKPTKGITFLTMLTAYTEEDQGNIAFQAESSTGKSYIPLELCQLFPEEDLLILASASPTAFYHDAGYFDKETKKIIVNLEKKILIFLDQPHFLLLERLRPLASHDQKVLHSKITDKTAKGGLRTKNVDIIGFCVIIFCSSKMNPDEQEKSRFILLSPETSQDKIRDSIYLLAKKLGNRDRFKTELETDIRRGWLKKRIKKLRDANIRNIIISGEEAIAKRFLRDHPYLAPRQQRDFPRLMIMIKSLALLNWVHRTKVDGNSIIANEDDVEGAFRLYDEVAKPNELGVAPQFYEIYNNIVVPLINNGAEVSKQDIATNYYQFYHRTIPDWRLRKEVLPELCQAGLLIDKPNPTDKRQVLYTLPPIHSPISPQNNGGMNRGGGSLLERFEIYIKSVRSIGSKRLLEDLGITKDQLNSLMASTKNCVWGPTKETINWRAAS